MKKIAIIGTENSHASAFASLLEKNEKVKIIGAFGTDKDANTRFESRFGVDCSATSADTFAGLVDGVMITSRYGSTHFESALPYLTNGMTVFIDKPITVKTDEALEIARISEANGVKLCGGSCLKYAPSLKALRRAVDASSEPVCAATFGAPLDINSPYDGFFFYSQHLVEMCLTVLGCNIRSVLASRNQDKVTALLNYGEFTATLSFASNIYTASVTFESKEKHTAVNNVTRLYANELSYFLSLLDGGEMKYSYADIVYPVKILNAIFDSYSLGKEIVISDT